MIRRPLFAASAFAALAASAFAAGPYRVVQEPDGRFWYSDAAGTKFISVGINNVSASHDYKPPAGSIYYDAVKTAFGGDFAKWQASVAEILHGAKFNTIGAWSTPTANNGDFYDTPILYVAGGEKLRMLDALRPGFEESVAATTREVMAKVGHPDKVLGVFLDNEMAWYGLSPWDDNPRHTILEESLKLAAGHVHREVAVDFLKSRYKTPAEFATAWGVSEVSWSELNLASVRGARTPQAAADRAAFLKLAADAFYTKATKAVRGVLPGTLILGTRFAGNAPDEVIAACGANCDVVSFNNYSASGNADANLIARYWVIGKKPMMVTEFSWRARENTSGNPNTGGAGSVVDTQRQRGEKYAQFTRENLDYPMIVGMHFFQFSDQSPQGRFDGENSNYGVVDIYHRPYKDLLELMAATNGALHQHHAASKKSAPTELPKPGAKATFQPGQFPNRPPQIELIGVETVQPPASFGASDAKIELVAAKKGLAVTLSTGDSWGAGISFSGPKHLAVEASTTGGSDLDGYEFLVLEATMPKGVEFRFVIDEGGVAAPGSGKYETAGGDDGESFALPPAVSAGGRETFKFDLRELESRYEWGNQTGKRRVDMNSLKGPAIIFSSGLSNTTVTIHSLRFER